MGNNGKKKIKKKVKLQKNKSRVINATKYKNNGKECRSKKILEGPCIFPFKEKVRGPIYTECAKSKDGDWCATEVEVDKKGENMMTRYGFCDYSDENISNVENNELNIKMEVKKNEPNIKVKTLPVFKSKNKITKAHTDNNNKVFKSKQSNKLQLKRIKSDNIVLRNKLYPDLYIDDRLIINLPNKT